MDGILSFHDRNMTRPNRSSCLSCIEVDDIPVFDLGQENMPAISYRNVSMQDDLFWEQRVIGYPIDYASQLEIELAYP